MKHSDAARLDFLQRRAMTSGTTVDNERVVIFIAKYTGKRPPTLRRAIDLAMKEEAKKEKL